MHTPAGCVNVERNWAGSILGPYRILGRERGRQSDEWSRRLAAWGAIGATDGI
jgi:hypothetical protein